MWGEGKLGHILVWVLFNMLLLQSLTLKHISREASEPLHGGNEEAGAVVLVMVVLLVAQVAHWGHGKAPGLADSMCTHQSRVFQHLGSFALPFPTPCPGDQYFTNTVNLSSLNNCLCTKMGTQLLRNYFFCKRPMILSVCGTNGNRTFLDILSK